MPRAFRAHTQSIRAGGFPVFEVQRDLNSRVGVGSIQNAGGFVRLQLARIADAATGDVTFRNCPDSMPDHGLELLAQSMRAGLPCAIFLPGSTISPPARALSGCFNQ